MSELTKEQFLKDVQSHKLTVLHDSEKYRHLKSGSAAWMILLYTTNGLAMQFRWLYFSMIILKRSYNE